MKKTKKPKLADNFLKIHEAAQRSDDGQRCMIAPHPDLKKKIDAEIKKLKQGTKKSILANKIRMGREDRPVGLNDGLIYPGTMFPLGTTADVARSAAANRAPLRGTVRVAVILVDFPDKAFATAKSHYEDLFFSVGTVATGSVREYYREVTHGLVDIQGQVVGPFRMPKKITEYANGDSGTGSASPNARTMAKDAAVAANPSINFVPFDNDGDGFVDAFIVVHAGRGAEETGSVDDIWSHKWVIEGSAYTADGTTKIYSYLTVPEDCKLGVCAHELGHLLFGFPDLYDTDNSSEGIGNWCLMAGGSWNNGGNTPAHPGAWCKCQQGWVTQENHTTNHSNVAIEDVKSGYKVHRLWKSGTMGNEYFLVENRQKTLFDKFLPKEGLLIWHIDDAISSNTNEAHYKVALMQADGNKDMELNHNRGDAGDVFPGSTNNRTFNGSSNPSSKSYAGSSTCVAITNISDPANIMHADLSVSCRVKIKEVHGKEFIKLEKLEAKEIKEIRKENVKEFKEFKEFRKESFTEKNQIHDKFTAHDKQLIEKPLSEGKFQDKLSDGKFQDKLNEGGNGGLGGGGLGFSPGSGSVEERLAFLEAQLSNIQPFIGQSLRPDLSEGALQGEEGDE